jgi:hypothetical protein
LEENDDEEKESDDTQPRLITAAEAVQSLEDIHNYVCSLANVPEEHLNSLYALHCMCVSQCLQSKQKQTKISDFFK